VYDKKNIKRKEQAMRKLNHEDIDDLIFRDEEYSASDR
jgi:hypothetical protein